MASGKKSKQRRRTAAAAPPVRRKGQRSRTASPRVLAIAGVLAVAVVIAVVLAVVTTGGKSSSFGSLPTRGTLTNAVPGASDVHSLLKNVPQRGLTLGSPSAPVTLVEYIDLQCPFCQQFETQVMPQIVQRYVRTGKVKVEVRPLAFIGPDSVRARNALIAAGAQGKAFDFAQLVYDNQGVENTGWLDDHFVARVAESIAGANPRALFGALDSSTVQQQADTMDNAATSNGVKSTPTLFVGKSGTAGQRVQLASPTDLSSLTQAIQAALGKS